MTLHDYADRDKTFSFRRVDGEIIQHLPILRETWVLSFRGRVQSMLDDDDHVPYFLLPYLGSGSTLRGYPTGRFRDRQALLTSAEFRWIPSRLALDMALFYDAGKVASRAARISTSTISRPTGASASGSMARASTPLRLEARARLRGLAPGHLDRAPHSDSERAHHAHRLHDDSSLAPPRALSAALAAAVLSPSAQSRPKFLSDDPLQREPETQDASKARSGRSASPPT